MAAAPGAAELRAGAAKTDITPDVQARAIPLGGYAARKGARATGVHDPVFARALVLANGKTKVGVVSLDLCFLPANVKAEVMKRITAKGVTGLDAAHLLMAATHSHTAPDPLAMHSGNKFHFPGWTSFDAKLLDETAAKIADAVVRADANMVPAHLASAVISTKPPLNRNRRGDTLTDPDMTLLKVTDAQGKAIAALVNFAAHPTLYDDDMMQVSSDWPGVTTAELEKRLGSNAVCLFLNGAEGDASPNDNSPKGTRPNEKVRAYGERVTTTAWDGLTKTKADKSKSDRESVAAWTESVTLPPRKPNVLYLLAAGQLGITSAQAKTLVEGLMPTTTQIAFVRVGPVMLMGFPCEPSAAIGLAAKAMARKANDGEPAVVALANDWLAYALTPEQYRAGKYETGMSFYGSAFGPTLLAGVEKGLKRRN